MKRRMLVGSVLASILLAACSAGADPASPKASASSGEGTKQHVKIGAATIVSHPSLDLIYEGIVEGLKEAGYEQGKNLDIRLENPQGDQATLTNIANTFAGGDEDLYVAIATPPAQALAQVIQDKPIVFASVTDPIAAGLVDSMEKPGGNVTGTSDQIPADQQLKVLRRILPQMKTLGIVYSSSEVNAEVQAKAMRDTAEAAGIKVEMKTIVNSSEVAQAAETLQVDAYWTGNDNAVVAALESLIQVAEQHHSFVFTSDADSVARGAGASYATDYKAQGVQTAGLIVKILQGAKPAEVSAEIQTSLELTVNPEAAKRTGVEIPADVLEEADRTV